MADKEFKREKQSAEAQVEQPGGSQSEPSNPADEPMISDQLEILREERDALNDKYLRAHAELENFRKRVSREREDERRYAALPIVRDLLPVLDNLRRAVDAAAQGGTVEDLRHGVEMTIQQAHDVLKRYRVEPIEAEGQAFDPNLHEALTQIPSAEHPPMTILQEAERGYTLHDRVVRPSKVIVASLPPAEEDSD